MASELIQKNPDFLEAPMEPDQLALFGRYVARTERIDEQFRVEHGPIGYFGPFLDEVISYTGLKRLEDITSAAGGDPNCGNWLTLGGLLWLAQYYPGIISSGLNGITWQTMEAHPRIMECRPSNQERALTLGQDDANCLQSVIREVPVLTS